MTPEELDSLRNAKIVFVERQTTGDEYRKFIEHLLLENARLRAENAILRSQPSPQLVIPAMPWVVTCSAKVGDNNG